MLIHHRLAALGSLGVGSIPYTAISAVPSTLMSLCTARSASLRSALATSGDRNLAIDTAGIYRELAQGRPLVLPYCLPVR